MRLILILCSVVLGCGEDPPFPEDYQTSWQEVVPCSEGSVHDGNSIRIFVNEVAQSTWSDWKQRVRFPPPPPFIALKTLCFHYS